MAVNAVQRQTDEVMEERVISDDERRNKKTENSQNESAKVPHM